MSDETRIGTRRRTWLLVLLCAPIILDLMGAQGENTAFSCSVQGQIEQVAGPCQGDGSIDCLALDGALPNWTPLGGSPLGGGSSSDGGSSPDAGSCEQGGFVSPACATVFLGHAATFTTIEGPDASIAWSVSCTGASPATGVVDVDGGTAYVNPLGVNGDTPGTCTLTGTGASGTGTATITVPPDPTGVYGTISYGGAAQGQVYVGCLSDGFPAHSGFTAIAAWEQPDGEVVRYRILGANCSGYVAAFMDTLGDGLANVAADPFGMQDISPSGGQEVSLTLFDPVASSDEGSAPSIYAIVPESSGVTLSYEPALSQGQESTGTYLISYTTNPSAAEPTGCLGVPSNPYDLAFIEGLAAGSYYFAIQAAASIEAGCPASSGQTWTPDPSDAGYPIGGNLGTTLSGALDIAPGATAGVTGTSVLHVLVEAEGEGNGGGNGASLPFVPTGAGSADITGENEGDVPYTVPYLSDGGAQYIVAAAVDYAGKGWLEPTDYLGMAFDPFVFLEALLNINQAHALTWNLPSTGAGEEQTSTLQNQVATAWTLSYVEHDPGQPLSVTLLYLVLPGGKPVVEATRLGWSGDTSPGQDIDSLFNVTGGPLPAPAGLPFLGTPQAGPLNSLPAVPVTVDYLVRFVDGSEQSLTSTLEDAFDTGLAVTLSPLTGGQVEGTTPTISWTSATTTTSGNRVDHYDVLVAANGSGDTPTCGGLFNNGYSGEIVSEQTFGPGTNSVQLTGIETGVKYCYFIAAVDSYGDMDVVRGTFSSVANNGAGGSADGGQAGTDGPSCAALGARCPGDGGSCCGFYTCASDGTCELPTLGADCSVDPVCTYGLTCGPVHLCCGGEGSACGDSNACCASDCNAGVCGQPDGGSADGGNQDAGSTDGGEQDAGSSDGGSDGG
jgi:hypothetical protein